MTGEVKVTSIRHEGDRVLFIQNGKLMLNMPWDAALEIADALYKQAKLAEEWAKREQIAQDSAISLRAGGPALTNNPDILKRAHAIATYDLPRYMRKDKRHKD